MDALHLALAGVRGLRPYQPGKPVEELERELGIGGIIKLASNENPLGPSPRALAAARAALAGAARYPDGGGHQLRSALASRLGVGPEQITLGNGSNDVLELVTRVFVAPHHEVVFSRHAFAVYPLVTQAQGAKAVVVADRNWACDLEAMGNAITPRTRVVFVANPNNPTGTWHRAQELESFLRRVPDSCVAVVDDAYFEYVEEADYPDTLGWLAQMPNLLVTRTFSKAYGLAGLRIGYGVSSATIGDLLNRVRQPFNVNSIALAAATAALEDTEHLRRSRAVNRQGLRQLAEGFTDLGLPWIPSIANFLCVEVGPQAPHIYQALLRSGVIVRAVDNYAMPDHLRVTVGKPEENARLLAALGRVLA